MTARKADIVIIGAGIAGLWTFHRLKKRGYDVLLLEKDSIGSGQTLASQGIIHSGLKFAIAGKISTLARSISAMPEVWRSALKGEGEVDLSTAKKAAESQMLLIPGGLIGNISKVIAKKTLGKNVREIPQKDWPAEIAQSGFSGSVVHMDELVLDIPSVLCALAEPYRNAIRKVPVDYASNPTEFLARENIVAKKMIMTSASSNLLIARQADHEQGLEVQYRPLLMGMVKPAPFPLFAHLIGTSEKPLATVTTHKDKDGVLVWYLGGGLAERAKESSLRDVYEAARKAFATYMPSIDLTQAKWSVLPIDRVEGKSKTDGWMPDTPTLHAAGNSLYAWPTKLTFAPMLSDMILQQLEKEGVAPSGQKTDWTFLPPAAYGLPPWDHAQWTD